MFRPISLAIGLRYTRAKKRNHFISFISLSSMLGIALGVTVLITVLSVMNGFDKEIRLRVFGMARQVSVSRYDQKVNNWQGLLTQLRSKPGVQGAAPYIDGQGMLTHHGMVQAVAVTGILPQHEVSVNGLAQHMIKGSLNALKKGSYGVVLGQSLALSLGLHVGDSVLLVTPEASVTPAGMLPRLKRFHVVGIFKLGRGFGFDSNYAFINLYDAQVLYRLKQAISGIQLKLNDLYQAPMFAEQLTKQLPDLFLISDWTRQYGSFFKAIALEKTMMFVILILIIAVAAFNLVSSLVMVVTDKQADIAILRTLGATPGMILRIFIVQGAAVGIIGTLLGLAGGIALSLNVTTLVNHLQALLGVQLLQSDVYYVNYLPSQLMASDVWHVCGIALLLALLATLYPAWRAAKTEPAEALRYE